MDTSSEAYQTQYQKVYDALSRLDTRYQVLATKVNNAIKLSIDKYVSSSTRRKKAAGRRHPPKGRVSVSLRKKASSVTTPYGALPQPVLGLYGCGRCRHLRTGKILPVHLGRCKWPHHYPPQRLGNAIADENATTYAAKDGSNLVLSLDVNVQEIVERYLNEAMQPTRWRTAAAPS